MQAGSSEQITRIPSVQGSTIPSEDLAHHLLRRHTHCFDRKLATAHVKQVLKIGSQEINRKDIVQSLLAKMMNLGNADWIAVGSVKKTRRASCCAVSAWNIMDDERRTGAVQGTI